MKSNFFYCVIAIAILACGMISCTSSNDKEGSGKDGETTTGAQKNQPLNVSIFIDLSHRIVEESDGLKGVDKDTAIVSIITDYISTNAYKHKIKFNKDHIKVFFHPAPTDPNTAKLAQQLEVNFAEFDKAQIQEKMNAASDLTKNFNSYLKTIYDAAIQQSNFIGSDIWGFFNTKAQKNCVMDGYRNVLVVITDGYIYHKDNLNEDKANKQSTFITKRSLADGYSLKPVGKIHDLEVLMLELKTNPVSDFEKMRSTISDWFGAIGITNYDILETDLPANLKKPITDFLNGNSK